MSSTVGHIETLFNKVKQYTETSIELYKLSAIDTSADIVSSLASRAITLLIVSTCITFLNFGLAFLIGSALGDYFKGFFIVSFFYLIVAIIVYAFNKSLIQRPVTDLVITKLMKTKIKETGTDVVIPNSKIEQDEQIQY